MRRRITGSFERCAMAGEVGIVPSFPTKYGIMPPGDARARHVHPRVAVLLGALLTVPVIVLEQQGITGPWLTAADWIIWLLFVAEFVVSGRRVSDRRRYLRRRWMTVAVIIVSFPPLPGLLSAARLGRLVLVPRVLR